MINTKNILAAGLLSILSTNVFADDASIAAGKEKSLICASCHGSKGISYGPLWPNLAGLSQAYIQKQLLDFRSGKRKDPMMAAMTKSLSDTDIKNLADYYASLK